MPSFLYGKSEAYGRRRQPCGEVQEKIQYVAKYSSSDKTFAYFSVNMRMFGACYGLSLTGTRVLAISAGAAPGFFALQLVQILNKLRQSLEVYLKSERRPTFVYFA